MAFDPTKGESFYAQVSRCEREYWERVRLPDLAHERAEDNLEARIKEEGAK